MHCSLLKHLSWKRAKSDWSNVSDGTCEGAAIERGTAEVRFKEAKVGERRFRRRQN